MKKIVIFGSTGTTGLCALDHAIKKNLEVTVLVRDETKIPADIKDNLNIIVGDVTNFEDVDKAVIGQDGVVVVLGTRNDLGPTTAMSDGMKNIIQSMKKNKIDVVSICLSAFLFYQDDKVPAIYRNVTDDHKRMFDAIKASQLKWIAVLPPHIQDSPNSDYTIKYDESPGRVVSKRDLGGFLIDSIDKPEHYQKICGITSKSI